ncbi:MAG: histidine phosphatase family protein [Janthinobacterium lividum]
MRLLLIRHGQTPANVLGALDTAVPGLELTGLGRAQAAAVPDALADERLDSVHATRLVRTQLTAAPLGAVRHLPVQVSPGLEEVSAGDLEMRSDPEAVAGYVDCLAAWMAGDLDRAMPGGPDGQAFWRRYDGAITAIAAQHGPDATAAVVSHGAAIRVFTALATRMPVEQAYELRLANTGMAALEGDPGTGWHLRSWQADPLGGTSLLDVAASDVTGDSADDA